MKKEKIGFYLVILIILMVFTGCAAGNIMYDEEPAGFWAGLWHGLIMVVTFIISLFTDKVTVYEINNSGGWYNFGFVLGAVIALGHGHVHAAVKEKKCCRSDEKEWEEIGIKVEKKIKAGLKKWVEEEDTASGEKKDTDWDEIARKVEEKIKRELKDWADK